MLLGRDQRFLPRILFFLVSIGTLSRAARAREHGRRGRERDSSARDTWRAHVISPVDQYLAIPKVGRQSIAGSEINSASALGSPESNRPTLHARVWLLMLFKGTDRDLAINIHRPRSIINNAARAFKGHHIVQLEPCSSRYTYLERERVFQAERPCEILRN